MDEGEEFFDCVSDPESTCHQRCDESTDNKTALDEVTESAAAMSIDTPVMSTDANEEESKYFVDEVHMKELDSLMTDAEREEHHQAALELKKEGNYAFVNSNWDESIEIYTRALKTCPSSCQATRAILYSNRAACFAKLEKNELAIADCSKAIEYDAAYAKVYYRRAQLYELKEDTWDKALDDYRLAYQLQPENKVAAAALLRLPPMIEERNERMKTEMMAKLKDLGNVILRPFGLSTDNFKMEPNESGGYSLKIQK